MTMLINYVYRKGMLFWLLVATSCLFPTTAGAGPQMTFGPNNEGMLQLDYKGQFQMIMRDAGSGPENEGTTSQFNFRRNRLAFMGQYGDSLSLYVQTDFTEDENIITLGESDTAGESEFEVLDAVIRFKVNDAFRVNIGKFKYNLSRENLEDCFGPLTLDRSLFIRPSYVSTRDKGVAVWGNVGGGFIQYRLDAMNGRLATSAEAPAPESNFRYSARAHISLLEPEKEYGYKGTYLGEKRVLTIGAAAQIEPDVAYEDTVLKAGRKDYTAWTADVFFEYPFPSIGTITLSAAYEEINLDNAYQSSNPDPDTLGLTGEKNGSYVKAAYLLPSIPLQLFGRYEEWSFAELNSVADQKLIWSAAGINYYFNKQNLKLTLEYSVSDFDKEGIFGGVVTKDFSTFITQLQLLF
jgi:hypothetical protein